MEKPKSFKIRVERDYGEYIEMDVHWEADVEEWKEVFKTILIWLTYDPSIFKEIFIEEE